MFLLLFNCLYCSGWVSCWISGGLHYIRLTYCGNVTVNNTVENTSEGTFKRADRHGVTSSTTGTGTVTLQAGSSAVKRVFVMSGVDGTILGEVNAPKISNRSDVSFTFSVGASIENYLYIEKTDRSPCVYRVTYTAA